MEKGQQEEKHRHGIDARSIDTTTNHIVAALCEAETECNSDRALAEEQDERGEATDAESRGLVPKLLEGLKTVVIEPNNGHQNNNEVGHLLPAQLEGELLSAITGPKGVLDFVPSSGIVVIGDCVVDLRVSIIINCIIALRVVVVCGDSVVDVIIGNVIVAQPAGP